MIFLEQFQIDVAKGRLTFLLAIGICLMLRVFIAITWTDVLSLLVCACTAYSLIEANTAFTLIRTRTTFEVSLYIFLSTLASLFLPYSPMEWTVPLLMLSLFALFRSYESSHASSSIFHAFLFLSVGSLLFPMLLWLSPFFFVGMLFFRSFDARSFFAAWLGLGIPYWFYFGYAFLTHRMASFYQQIEALFTWKPWQFEWMEWPFLLFLAIVWMLSVVSSGHYLFVSYQDKTRTRLFLSYLIALEVGLWLMGLLQPQYLATVLQLLLLPSAILTAHLFTLTHNRFSGIYFLCTFAGLTIITLLLLWMQFFNF